MLLLPPLMMMMLMLPERSRRRIIQCLYKDVLRTDLLLVTVSALVSQSAATNTRCQFQYVRQRGSLISVWLHQSGIRFVL
jgi:hypothetical protein